MGTRPVVLAEIMWAIGDKIIFFRIGNVFRSNLGRCSHFQPIFFRIYSIGAKTQRAKTTEVYRVSPTRQHSVSQQSETCLTNLILNRYLKFSHRWLWRMPSSGQWRCVPLVRSDISEELLLRLLQLLVTSNFVSRFLIISTLMMEAIRSSEISVLTRATRPHISEDEILR
jgi:hypothetical protein